jgi:hypothetical protein
MSLSLDLPWRRPDLDTVGAVASLVCAVHCAVVALVLGVTPAVALFAASWVEWAFLLTSAVVGLGALVPGYRRHGLRRPLVLFTCGMSMLLALRQLRATPSLSEMTAVAVAAACLVSAHWINRGALHRCACGPHHH